MAAELTDFDLEPSGRAVAFGQAIFFSLAGPSAAWSSEYVSQVLTRMASVMVDIQAIQEAVDTEIPTVGSGPPR